MERRDQVAQHIDAMERGIVKHREILEGEEAQLAKFVAEIGGTETDRPMKNAKGEIYLRDMTEKAAEKEALAGEAPPA